MASNKITYVNKVATKPVTNPINQFMDVDANELKEKHNLNDDRITQNEADILATASGFKGLLAISDPTPTSDGVYRASETGTYTNAGGLVTDLSLGVNDILVSNNQTSFVLQITPVNTVPTGAIAENNPDAVKGGDIYDLGITKSNITNTSITPVFSQNARVRPGLVIPGYYYNAFAGSTAYDFIEVKGDTKYIFEDCTHTFDTINALCFLNKNKQLLNIYAGAANVEFSTPIDCKFVLFSLPNTAIGANLKFKESTIQVEGYEKQPPTRTIGVNLTDGRYYPIDYIDDSGTLGFAYKIQVLSSSYFPVVEGKRYYYYSNLTSTVKMALLDINDNVVKIFNSPFQSYATTDTYLAFDIEVGLGAVKAAVQVAESTTQVNEVVAGTRKWIVVEEENLSIIQKEFKGTYDKPVVEIVNEVIKSKERINKKFTDKNFLLISDSTGAAQTQAEEAYFSPTTSGFFAGSQGTNQMYGGWTAGLVRNLRPRTWSNFSNGGFTLSYDGNYFGSDIYTNGDAGNYLYLLEKFIYEYDDYIANPTTAPKRFAPDILMIASNINDWSVTKNPWVNDADVAASGKSYDVYMNDTFVSTGISSDTLIPLENIDLSKAAGALRYILERVSKKFPKCFIYVITSNKTTVHARDIQAKVTRDVIWMAQMFNAKVIDLWGGGSQLTMIREYKDSVTGTRDDLYLTVDGIHDFGGAGKGWQRHSRFITNEIINSYYDLEDFTV